MPDVSIVRDYLQLFLSFANVVIIGYGLFKFLNKPHDTLEERVNAHDEKLKEHDLKLKEVEDSLHHGNDKFRDQEKTNGTFKSVLLSFIDFEIAYCLHTNYEFTDDLLKAKKELQDYLSNKN